MYKIKHKVEGKMVWLKHEGSVVTFNTKKKAKNFAKNRRHTHLASNEFFIHNLITKEKVKCSIC